MDLAAIRELHEMGATSVDVTFPGGVRVVATFGPQVSEEPTQQVQPQDSSARDPRAVALRATGGLARLAALDD